MIDLHTHTYVSDGVLGAAELVSRSRDNGCTAVALTDHADYSNIDLAVSSALRSSKTLGRFYGLDVIAGVELTYIPPADIGPMVKEARALGAEIVVVHGETPAENVPAGTNEAALKAGCDILAHPGRITPGECALAARNRVFLELTTRAGHRATNRHVAAAALEHGCRLVLNTDSHAPGDLLDMEKVAGVLRECGLERGLYDEFLKNSYEIVKSVKERRQ